MALRTSERDGVTFWIVSYGHAQLDVASMQGKLDFVMPLLSNTMAGSNTKIAPVWCEFGNAISARVCILLQDDLGPFVDS